MAEEQDNWFKDTLGIDVDQLRQAVSSTASPIQADPSAVVGTLKGIGQGITDGINNTASTISDMGAQVLQSDTVQTLNQVGNTTANFEKGVAEGVVSGVGDLLDMSPAGRVVDGVKTIGRIATADDSVAEFEKVAGEKIDSAVTAAKFAGNAVVDPEGTGEAIGTEIRKGFDQAAAQGDGAEFIGKGVGKGVVIAATVAVTAGAAGAGVAGEEGAAVLADEGAALGRSGAALADDGTVIGQGAKALGDGGALDAAADAGGTQPSPLAETGGPDSAPPTFDPAAPDSAGLDSNAGPFGRPSGPGVGPDFDPRIKINPDLAPDRPPEGLPPVSEPTTGPETPRVPEEAPAVDPAPPSLAPATEPNPPFENPPPSKLPDFDVPPPDTQPIPVKPGFPFGTDDP